MKYKLYQNDKEIQTNNFEIIEKKQENVNEIHENSTVIKTQEKEKVDLSPENHSSLQEEKNDLDKRKADNE